MISADVPSEKNEYAVEVMTDQMRSILVKAFGDIANVCFTLGHITTTDFKSIIPNDRKLNSW